MDYITLSENEPLDNWFKVAEQDIECFKVIEERLSPSGRIEYQTFPMYAPLSQEIVETGVPQHPQGEMKPIEFNGKVKLDEGFVHAYRKIDDAVKFMEVSCIGYDETRPAIYKCVIPKGTQYFETLKRSNYESDTESYATTQLRYVQPIYERVRGKTRDWHRMEKPEKKKKFGIIFDEAQIEEDNYNE